MNKNILLIEHDRDVIHLACGACADVRSGSYSVECVNQLSEGMARLEKPGIDIVIVNLFLPDSRGLETFAKLILASPHVSVLVLSCPEHEETASLAVERGAQDFLLTDPLDSYSLPRVLRDVMERKAAAEALFFERDLAQVTLSSIGDAVLSTDVSGKVSYLNPIAKKMTGWSRAEACGRPLEEVFHIIDGSTRERVRNPLALAVQVNTTVGLTPNCVLIRRDGVEASIEDSASPIHDLEGKPRGAVIVFHDVSAARAAADRMSHLAQPDVLTDLPNRMLLNDRAQGCDEAQGYFLSPPTVPEEFTKLLETGLPQIVIAA